MTVWSSVTNASAFVEGPQGTLRRLWDDLRTACDLLGEQIAKGKEAHPKGIENVADGVDDIAAQLYKLVERLKTPV